MKNAEQIADEILESAQNIKRAKAPDFLLNNILERVSQENEIIPIHKLKWFAIAASFIIGVNIFSIYSESKNSDQQKTSTKTAENILSNYDLYKI